MCRTNLMPLRKAKLDFKRKPNPIFLFFHIFFFGMQLWARRQNFPNKSHIQKKTQTPAIRYGKVEFVKSRETQDSFKYILCSYLDNSRSDSGVCVCVRGRERERAAFLFLR